MSLKNDGEIAQFAPPSSSSLNHTYEKINSTHTYDDDDDEEANKKTFVPRELRPDPDLRHYEDAYALTLVLVQRLGLKLNFARSAVVKYGLTACEGALINTLAFMSMGVPRVPSRWFHATLKRGLAWSPARVDEYIADEWETVILRMERSDDITYQRLARQERLRRGQGPENVVAFTDRRESSDGESATAAINE